MNKPVLARREYSLSHILFECPHCEMDNEIAIDKFNICYEEFWYPVGNVTIECEYCDKEIEIEEFEDA